MDQGNRINYFEGTRYSNDNNRLFSPPSSLDCSLYVKRYLVVLGNPITRANDEIFSFDEFNRKTTH